MFIFAVLLVYVTKQVAMRTLHIRAKSFGVPLLVACGSERSGGLDICDRDANDGRSCRMICTQEHRRREVLPPHRRRHLRRCDH